MSEFSPSMVTAEWIIDALRQAGVRYFVVCPGSRSAPLAYALANVEDELRASGGEVVISTDERSAAFMALGYGRATGIPAAVIMTSGSAPAHTLPAVTEAWHSSIPLIVLSADRPASMRGVGANQTSNHLGMLREFVRTQLDIPAGDEPEQPWRGALIRAVAASQGRLPGGDQSSDRPGPIHINVGFREPLTPDFASHTDSHTNPRPHASRPEPKAFDGTVMLWAHSPSPRDRALMEPLAALAEEKNWPILVEAGATLPATSAPIYGGLPLLAEAICPSQVILVGRPTLSRPVSRLLATTTVIAVDVDPLYPDVAGTVRRVIPRHSECDELRDLPANPPTSTLVRAITRADEARRCAVIHHSESNEVSLAAFVRALAPATIMGASSVIRDCDLFAPEPVNVVASRGLAGIDGTIATARGIADALGTRQVAVMGDLAFLHDATSLVRASASPSPALDVVVMDDGGGRIFSTVEHAHAPADVYMRFFRTPTTLDVRSAAVMAGVEYVAVRSARELEKELTTPPAGMRVIHVQLPDVDELNAGRRELLDQVRQGIAEALSTL